MDGRTSLKTWLAMTVFMLALHAGTGLTSALSQCELSKLLASDGAASDYFGYSVAISGDTAVIGAYHDDDNGGDSGSAYVFGPGKTGDFDNDCDVDFDDFAIFANHWLEGK